MGEEFGLEPKRKKQRQAQGKVDDYETGIGPSAKVALFCSITINSERRDCKGVVRKESCS
jgi:hypothetical protein